MDCGTGGSSSSSSAAVGAISSTHSSLSARSKKISSPHQYTSHGLTSEHGLTNTSEQSPITYKSPQLQHQRSGGFAVQGYDAGVSTAIRPSSRDSGSSSSRAASRIGSRGGGASTMSGASSSNKRLRNTSRGRPDRSSHMDPDTQLQNEIFKGNYHLASLYSGHD